MGTLNGTIFLDGNQDGSQEGADVAVPTGYLVGLYKADGTLYGTTTTSATGLYSFTGVPAGNYLLRILPPANSTFSPVGLNPSLPDSTLTSSNQAVTLTSSGTTTVNAGFYSTNSASITGTVFIDSNADGLIDGTDTGLAGVTVTLLNGSGTAVTTTTTAADGTYNFYNLAAGTYSEQFSRPAGYSYSTLNDGTNPSPFIPGAAITASTNLLTNGSFEQYSRNTGYAASFTGWTETASTTATPWGTGPGNGPEVQPTNGSANGTYGVTATPDTQNTTGYSGNVALYLVDDGAIETVSQTLTLTAGVTYEIGFDLDEPSVGAGNPGYFALTASIGNASGSHVILAMDSRGGTQLAIDKWTHFADLYTPTTSGTYTISFTYSSGVVGSTLFSKDVLVDDVYVHAGQITQNLTATSQVSAQGVTTPVSVSNGQTVGNESAGETPPTAGITGTLFSDANNDGIEDGSDAGIAGRSVTLYSGTGTAGAVVGTAVTNAGGVYSFTGLVPGNTYTVMFPTTTGAVFSPASTNSGTTNNTTGPSGIQTVVFPSSGGTNTVNSGVHNNSAATCFLAGTRILTDRGEIAVEHLAMHDMVATLEQGVITHRPIRWLGGRHLDEAAVIATGIRPIRIRAGAFADDVPHRDLLVTPEHCILIDGRLIPARMLVNGRSIIEDCTITAFTYHHVELEMHGILLAEGLTTESYLDTGNRRNFSSSAVIALLPELSVDAAHKSWNRDACAPLTTDRETVEPIWNILDRRAVVCGLADERRRSGLSDDPQLRVLLDDGTHVEASWNRGGRHFFQIPAGTTPLRLVSRSTVPALVVGPFVDDRRLLGVLVNRVVFWKGLYESVVTAAEIAVAGWHELEGDARWTDGNASLEFASRPAVSDFLEIQVSGSLDYEQDDGLVRLAA